jgi:hypothetical protein
MSKKILFEINRLPQYDGAMNALPPCAALCGAVVEFQRLVARGLAGDGRA